jgi:hypothetical protein
MAAKREGRRPQGVSRWGAVGVVALAIIAVFFALPGHSSRQPTHPSYAILFDDANLGKVQTMTVDRSNGVISGKLRTGTSYVVQGPVPSNPAWLAAIRDRDHVAIKFSGRVPHLREPHLPGGRAALLRQLG